MSTKAVRLDENNMKILADEREGFETPNECLSRLLKNQRTCQAVKDEEETEIQESES